MHKRNPHDIEIQKASLEVLKALDPIIREYDLTHVDLYYLERVAQRGKNVRRRRKRGVANGCR